jgi:hypothetical protein
MGTLAVLSYGFIIDEKDIVKLQQKLQLEKETEGEFNREDAKILQRSLKEHLNQGDTEEEDFYMQFMRDATDSIYGLAILYHNGKRKGQPLAQTSCSMYIWGYEGTS